MRNRIIATAGFLLFAIAAFIGVGPAVGVPGVLFGILFLALAMTTWRCWHIITGDYSPPGFDAMAGSFVNPGTSTDYYRGTDENYRRGDLPDFRESDPPRPLRVLRF